MYSFLLWFFKRRNAPALPPGRVPALTELPFLPCRHGRWTRSPGPGPSRVFGLTPADWRFLLPGKWKSLRACPAEYPGWTVPGGRPGGAQAKTKRTRHVARALPLRHRLVSGRVSGSPRLDYHHSPSERSRTSYLGGIMPCPKIARPMPPACGLRGRTDSRADCLARGPRNRPRLPDREGDASQSAGKHGRRRPARRHLLFRRTDRPRWHNARPPYAYPGFPPL